MRDYEGLFAYIPYFERMEGSASYRFDGEGRTEDGSFRFSQPVYDQRLLEFIEVVHESGLIDIAYFSILNRDLSSGCQNPAEHLEEASLDFLRAVLAYYVRQGRFQEGLWRTALRERVFLKVLRRLEVLLSEKGRPRISQG